MEVPVAVANWLVQLGVVPPSGYSQSPCREGYVMFDEFSTEAFESGVAVGEMLAILSAGAGQPQGLLPVEIDAFRHSKTPVARLHNWNMLAAPLATFSVSLDADSKALILAGDCGILEEVVTAVFAACQRGSPLPPAPAPLNPQPDRDTAHSAHGSDARPAPSAMDPGAPDQGGGSSRPTGYAAQYGDRSQAGKGKPSSAKASEPDTTKPSEPTSKAREPTNKGGEPATNYNYTATNHTGSGGATSAEPVDGNPGGMSLGHPAASRPQPNPLSAQGKGASVAQRPPAAPAVTAPTAGASSSSSAAATSTNRANNGTHHQHPPPLKMGQVEARGRTVPVGAALLGVARGPLATAGVLAGDLFQPSPNASHC
eukprot:jgi/Mesvir1/9633/Mv12130-RA.1